MLWQRQRAQLVVKNNWFSCTGKPVELSAVVMCHGMRAGLNLVICSHGVLLGTPSGAEGAIHPQETTVAASMGSALSSHHCLGLLVLLIFLPTQDSPVTSIQFCLSFTWRHKQISGKQRPLLMGPSISNISNDQGMASQM